MLAQQFPEGSAYVRNLACVVDKARLKWMRQHGGSLRGAIDAGCRE